MSRHFQGFIEQKLQYIKNLFINICRFSVQWPNFFLKRDADIHEFQPTMVEIEERPASPLGRSMFWIVVAIILCAIVWACIAKTDVVVSARGLIIPEGDVKVLQPLDTGVVSAITCREGDLVKKNQVLIEIDPSVIVPELESKQKDFQYANLEKMRIKASLGKEKFDPDKKIHDAEAIKIQENLYYSLTTGLRKQIDAKREEFKSTQEELSHNETMLEIAKDREKRMGGVIDIISRTEYEKAISDVFTYNKNIRQLKNKLIQIKHEIDYIKENFIQMNLKEYSDKHKAMTYINSEISKSSFKNKKQNIISPVDGHISNLYLHTIGGIVTPAQKLMVVVPTGTPLVARVNVLNKDIGFINEGMPVSVKVDAFDFQKYGTIYGLVKTISKHSVEDEKLGPVYEVFIVLRETTMKINGRTVFINSGMSLTAEIKINKRRVVEFFLYPLLKNLDEGIKIR